MKISIVTPVFHGNKYLDELIQSVEKSSKHHILELVLVNDSPDMQLSYPESQRVNIVRIDNKKNVGIHRSRINGVKKSTGDYVLFLDQDDLLMAGSIDEYVKVLEASYSRADVILGNGYIEDGRGTKNLIFKNKFSQKFATRERPYILARDFIVSPGQCLIRKNAIPDLWLTNNMNNNGMDDYLLWLLLFNDEAKFICSYYVSYIHKFTGENLSSNDEKMKKSQSEMIKILESNEYPLNKLRRIKNQVDFKNNYKKSPIKYFLKHPFIFLYNIYYRLVWRGYICKK